MVNKKVSDIVNENISDATILVTKKCGLPHNRHTGESRYSDVVPAEAGNPFDQAGCRIKPGMTKHRKTFLTSHGVRWVSLLMVVLILALGFPPYAICGSTPNREEKAVLKAARTFLDAEIRRDYPAVYACFAPSSAYLRTHTYEQYLAQAKVTPDRVVGYQIVRVSYIRDNNDPQTTTPADKIAQVEVEVTFLQEGSNQRTVVNIGFIFLKEGGKWYKS